ncbi:CRISPR system Cascade subunit CasD [Pseudoclavibacter triregionum]|nr:CRISPR system Cascade subunit CasD [Pseudoclavibacter triregionum]
MPVLLLELAAPWQAWGSESRFTRRATEPMPTKSGVVGLLAAAEGRRRTDPVEDLVKLRFGVRADQVGVSQTDFQTAIDWRTGESKPLSHRAYLSDARFLVALEGGRELLDGLAEAIRRPTFPLYLGRRSCPASGRIVRGVKEASLEEALRTEPWLAAEWYRRRQPRAASLAISRDARLDEAADERLHDVPVSFDPRRRDYAWRSVRHEWVRVDNPSGLDPAGHDPFSLLGGG